MATLSLTIPLAPAFGQTAPTPEPGATPAAVSGTIAGVVADQNNGLPIDDAHVDLYSGGVIVASTKTSSRGRFSFKVVRIGSYTAVASSRGYSSQRSSDIIVIQSQDTRIDFALTKSTGSDLKAIGTITSSTTSALAATTTITRSIDSQLLNNESYYRFADALYQVPGVNSGGLTAAVGDDSTINIRGLGSSETQALLDGHPVGPQGVYAINGGGSYPSGFNYSDSPYFGLSKTEVTFGSGANGLYGIDAIGGTINMITLNPTPTNKYAVQYGLGNQGQQEFAAKATGTMNRLGYVLEGSVQGLYGLFAPQQIVQTARPNNFNYGCTDQTDPTGSFTVYNLSPCNLAANTYLVSGNTNQRSGLAKLQYALSKNTTVTGTWYGSGLRSDSTGNGDADYIPSDTAEAFYSNNVSPNCAVPTDKAGTQSGYSVITVNNTTNANACYTLQQLTAEKSGPDGGGMDRNRGTSFFDYHGRIQSVSGHSTYTADYFFDHYKFYKSSVLAGGLDPTGTYYTGSAYSQFLNTQGILLSDDIASDKSDVGFGYFVEHQEQTRLDFDGTQPPGSQFSYEQPESLGLGSFFARASYNLSDTVSAFANAWEQASSVTGQSTFDPRLSLVYRPTTGHDVFRLTYGHTTGNPAPELKFQQAASINGNPSSLNPNCVLNSVGSGGNPAIKPEKADDFELGYAHRFQQDSSVSVNAYQTNVSDQLFAATEPLTQYPIGNVPQSILQAFANKIAGAGCTYQGQAVTAANVANLLGIDTTYNASTARAQGIELSGRQRFAREFYVDYSYDIQSSVQNGITDAILANNPTLINGAQIAGIPVHSGSIGLDYSRNGWEGRLDGIYIGENNGKDRPGYSYFNGFVSKDVGHGMMLTLGGQNIFNNATQNYGYFGHGLFIPENKFFSDKTSIQQFAVSGVGNELFGLPSATFLLQLTAKM